ncbi:glycoside hydrolase family 2 protein [Fontivita pretiosa]|uniref:glycoside hydrolase family 2 protein n=1 Tax=Fontivita pretiosa TaxID=2989684 RepID=UPI003D166246
MSKRRMKQSNGSLEPGRPEVRFGYPRPQLQRGDWICLDGQWQFAIDRDGSTDSPERVRFNRTIEVPFAPETPASGIVETGYFTTCWYRRQFDAPRLARDQRLLLHFGAVDYQASVWVNGRLAVTHEGGYTPFQADITDLLIPGKTQTIVVRADDDPHDLAKPRGKQDWKPRPHSIWYYRTSGIWQSVWLERVNATRIVRLCWIADPQQWGLILRARIIADPQARFPLKLYTRLSMRDRQLAEDVYAIPEPPGQIERTIALPDPGIDDARAELLWSPTSPNLIDAHIDLLDAEGNVLDSVSSYAAMRSIQIWRDRLVLNGKPITLQLVLNQGYWPHSGLTAPDDQAYRQDVELIKAMGFNGVRMHQKIENPRFLYWADKLGLLVWEEMPSTYTFSDQSIRRLTQQWIEAIERDISHPCIIAWVPFNESWGVPDLPSSAAQRHAVQALYHLTRCLDPTRPVIGNDGWEAAATDIITIHDYDPDPGRILQRYDTRSRDPAQILQREYPGHRMLLLPDFEYRGQPIMLSEFGGIAYSKDQDHTWGYSRAQSPEDLACRYAELLAAVRSLPVLAGFCYTQFTDTYQEANGLLYMDRTPKFPLDEIAVATRGPQSPQDQQIQARWRERLTSQERT